MFIKLHDFHGGKEVLVNMGNVISVKETPEDGTLVTMVQGYVRVSESLEEIEALVSPAAIELTSESVPATVKKASTRK